MNKFLKIMSLSLIVPVLGIGSLLTGCKKEEASINDIRNTYNEMINKYQSEGEKGVTEKSAANNGLFTYTNNIAKNAEGGYDYFGSSSSYDVDFRVTMDYLELGSTNNGIDVATDTETSEELILRYEQLNTVYEELLNYSNKYFVRYQKSFFVESSADAIDKKALHNLLGKLENLEDKVENFNSHLNDRESLGEFLGTKTQVMTTKLDTFNSVYIDLINANFEFVLEFCNVHKTYVLNADKVDASLIVNDVISERLIYEASLKYAYAYFLDNIKTFQNNGLATSVALSLTTSADYDLQNEVETLFANIADGWELQIADNDTEADAKNKELKDLLLQLEQSIARFDEFIKLYKVNVANFDMYTYNQLRASECGAENNTMYQSLDSFVESLSAENKARLTVIETFVTYDAYLLLQSMNNILNNTL